MKIEYRGWFVVAEWPVASVAKRRRQIFHRSMSRGEAEGVAAVWNRERVFDGRPLETGETVRAAECDVSICEV